MLSKLFLEKHVKEALAEDIGFWDITTENLSGKDRIITCELNAREDGIFCGAQVFETVFRTLSDGVEIKFLKKDGDEIRKGDKIAEITGTAKCVLTGERTALNYVQRMSGIATETNKYIKALDGYKTRIVDTRKTTPLFRVFEKYAVMTGGGGLHRFNLSDCVMIKDNHISLAGGIKEAVKEIRLGVSHAHKIEVECDTFEQVEEALDCGVDIIMLDNMTTEQMKECTDYIAGRAIVEASGNVRLSSVAEIASSGVDIISSSAIVAKAPTLDLGLDYNTQNMILKP